MQGRRGDPFRVRLRNAFPIDCDTKLKRIFDHETQRALKPKRGGRHDWKRAGAYSPIFGKIDCECDSLERALFENVTSAMNAAVPGAGSIVHRAQKRRRRR